MATEEKLLLWAVSTIAFHGSFRIHEILCRRETEYDPDFTLLEDDVTVNNFKSDMLSQGRVLQFSIKHPKEDKMGRVVMVDVYETGGPTCPAKAFCQWFDRRDKTTNKVLFRKNDGTRTADPRFNAHLRMLLSPHIDYGKGKITAHSFRSGIPSLLGQLGHT